MKIINDYVKANTEIPKILSSYLSDMKMCVFDIETLGLNPEYSELILSGFVEIDFDGMIKSTQFLAEDPTEERDVLLKTVEYLNSFDYVITYNGKHFDMPYVSKRCQKLKIPCFKKELYNLDIYLVINGHSPFKKLLPNLRQKTVEDFFGIGVNRADEISGKESIDFYYTYCSCSDYNVKSDMERQILLHNHDDIIQLFRMIPIIRRCDVHKAFHKLGFPVKGVEDLTSGISWDNFSIDKISLSSNKLEIVGRYPGNSVSYIGFETLEKPYNIELKNDNTFCMSFGVESMKGNIYVDLNAFGLCAMDFERYAGFVNNYLILKTRNETSYFEINMLSKAMIGKAMLETII